MKRFRLLNWLNRGRAPKPRVNIEVWMGDCEMFAVTQARGGGIV